MRIALLWKESIVRDAIANLLENRGRFDVVVSTNQAKDCLQAVREHGVHVIVAESDLMNSAQKQFLFGAKLLGSFGILFVTEDDELEGETPDGEVMVPVTLRREEFFEKIRECGTPYLEVQTGRGKRRGDKPYGLSTREYDVAALIAKGYSNRRISEETGIQEQSVKNTISTILRKLDCENRTQVALRLLV